AYSRNDIEIMSRVLKAGDIYIDAGANIGWHTVIAAKMVGSSGKVIAFEPEPKNLELLRRNIELNALTNVEVIPKAVMDEAGPRELHVSNFNSGDHIVGLSVATSAHVTKVSIEATTLDETIARLALDPAKIAMIKADIQGSEVDMLEGGRAFFRKRRPPLILEYSPRHMRWVGRSFFDLLSFIERNGYTPSHLDGEKHKPVPQILRPLSIQDFLRETHRLMSSPYDEAIDLYLTQQA
ncbi:MAG: FkbM family methyltransferase, partial [Bdellovibrionota bacterium]